MDTLHPGLYLQEIASQPPVQGVSTSVGAFVGVAEKGPIAKSGYVTSWNDFVSQYGSYLDNSYLAYAVRGFFENGGASAFISRVVHFDATNGKASTPATADVKDGSATPATYLTVDASSDGTWGNNIQVEVANLNGTTFDFNVYYQNSVVESFKKVTLATLEDIVAQQSKYVTVTVVSDTATVVMAKTPLTNGDDGLTGLVDSDYVGDSSNKNGLYAFDNDKINLVAVPGITSNTVANGVVTYVEGRGDCFAIVEVPLGKTPQTALTYKTTDANLSSDRVALYYSWVNVSDPIGVGKNPTKLVPPSGHVAGVYARTDSERGVFKSPAGIDAKLLGVINLEYVVSDAEQDLLNPEGVNCIRVFDGEGIIIWGARTCAVGSEYTYITTRRSVDYVEQSVLSLTRFAVFEPNNQTLWDKLTATAESFLRGFYRAGGLVGKDEASAFFFQCDNTTTTQDDINIGKVNASIGLATQKPSEFVIFGVSLRN